MSGGSIGIMSGTTVDGMTGATMINKQGIFKRDEASDGAHSAVFEDDGRVAYGYLLKGEQIVADVWLYNSGETPDYRPWTRTPRQLPFANPAEFISDSVFVPVQHDGDVKFVWHLNGPDGVAVDIYLRGQYHARMIAGSKPGWCRLVVKDGPLARRLSEGKD